MDLLFCTALIFPELLMAKLHNRTVLICFSHSWRNGRCRTDGIKQQIHDCSESFLPALLDVTYNMLYLILGSEVHVLCLIYTDFNGI